ncbi:MAG TPA: TIGR00366 family protein [Bacillales bacterium]|nr:TIGR00366 family protein [Bacillales bacterium]
MIRQMGAVFTRFSERFMPNPMIFAILLTIITFLMGIGLTDTGFMGMVKDWYSGFWNLLTFTMQMVLILVTGHALAVAPGVKGFIEKIAGKPNNNAHAAALTALVTCIFAWINWGLGLIVGALFALEVGKQAYKKGIKIHYPLVVAAGYSGQMVWHYGLSSSSALASATEGNFMEKIIGGLVPISESILTPYAILNSILMILIVVPVIFYFMAPKKEDSVGIESYAPQLLENESASSIEPVPDKETNRGKTNVADLLENSRLLSGFVVLIGLIYIVYHFITNGFDLNLNIVNFIFLIVGLLLHQTPIRYIDAITEATKGASGIILQFPFYGGIMGMISLSGLGAVIAGWLLTFATPFTLPAITWLTGGLVNIFVPSGGGEWSILGPIITPVAQDLGVPMGKIIVAFGAGDMWTNMFQPFWAIALLGITGMKARDIMGYCMALMILAAPFFFLGLTFIPY